MKNTRLKLAAFVAALSLAFGLGALSDGLVQQAVNEFLYRSGRAANWRDMFSMWPTAGAYFAGMSDGHYMSAQLLQKGTRPMVETPEYWQGLAYALQLDSQMMTTVVNEGVVP